MRLTEEVLDQLAHFPRSLEGSRQWRPTSRDNLLKRFGAKEFSEVRFVADVIDLYEGDDWEWSIARLGEVYYLRRIGLTHERDVEWLTMPVGSRAGVAIYVALRWRRALNQWAERRKRKREGRGGPGGGHL